ncbi:hypothetical protein lerEdw1_008103 [Lerista edwardsae]|nr:hypothetical protein lerEdw1_008103 [Lerista edwardsae]
MAWLARSLSDSQPVARFQRRCGLFPAGEARAVGNGSPQPPGRAACNGSPDGAWKDCPQEYVVKNYFYYYLFRISSAMGQEVFYITFLPFSYWIINPYLARRMVITWMLVMYIGQVLKDLLKWPRPCTPPVVKLEKRTMAEYGMPSTHAMAATAISFTFVLTTVKQYKYSIELGMIGALLFSTMVSLSRIYTGMHTVLDVIGGSLIAAVLTALSYPAQEVIDHLLITSPWGPVFCIIVPLLLCYHYPKLDHYSPTRADTATILGAGAGAIIGVWINIHIANHSVADVAHSIPSVTAALIWVTFAKVLVGIGVLLVIRQLIKSVILKALCLWYKVSTNDLEAIQQIEIEVPYKFITYTSVGLSATALVPLLHEFLGLN